MNDPIITQGPNAQSAYNDAMQIKLNSIRGRELKRSKIELSVVDSTLDATFSARRAEITNLPTNQLKRAKEVCAKFNIEITVLEN